MTDRLEWTLTIAAPIERVWRAYADPTELCRWYLPRINAFETRPGGRVDFVIPHAEGNVVGEVVAVEPPHRITWTEGPGLLPGTTEITARLAPSDGGTTVHQVQAGLGSGPEWADEIQSHELGWSQCLADLALYLETGLHPDRATRPKSRLGIVSLDVAAGMKVIGVRPGSFAERAGLRAGDLVTHLNGGSMFGRRELWFFSSEHAPGEQVTAEWVRDGAVMSGSSTLDGPPTNQSSRLEFQTQGSKSAR